jgi:hypothetical protein
LNRNDLHAEIAPKRVGIASVRGVHDSAPTREKRDWHDLAHSKRASVKIVYRDHDLSQSDNFIASRRFELEIKS